MINLFFWNALAVLLGWFIVLPHADGVLDDRDRADGCNGGTSQIFLQAMFLDPKAVHNPLIRELVRNQRARRFRMLYSEFEDRVAADTQIFSGFMRDVTHGKDCVEILSDEADGPVALPALGAGGAEPAESEDAVVVERLESKAGIQSTLKSIAIATALPIWDNDVPQYLKEKPRLRVIFAITESAPPKEGRSRLRFRPGGAGTCASGNPTLSELSQELRRTDTMLVLVVPSEHKTAWERAFYPINRFYPLVIDMPPMTLAHKSSTAANKDAYVRRGVESAVDAAKKQACKRYSGKKVTYSTEELGEARRWESMPKPNYDSPIKVPITTNYNNAPSLSREEWEAGWRVE